MLRADPAAPTGRLTCYPGFTSRYVAPREVDVWVPPGYGESPSERYPVIYVEDGQNLFNPKTSYTGHTWEIAGAMDRLIASGQTRGAIVVGIWNSGLTRSADYIPAKAVSVSDVAKVANAYATQSHPIVSDLYLKFLVDELKPFVDRTYRTKPDEAHTFAMGSSIGALISLYALAEYPSVFGAAACLSTHWLAGDGAMITYLETHLPSAADHRIYFDHGTKTLDAQYGPDQERMDAVMRSHGYRPGASWETRVFPGADHSEVSWSKRMEIPLAFLLKAGGRTTR
ncbi:MAG TPA: alpha/beta hydrolase-fold protein [Opitutaceae bacterium]